MAPKGQRDWESLRKDIKTLGEKATAEKHGYKNVSTMNGSIRHHEYQVSREPRPRTQTVTLIERGSLAEPEIPEAIQKQLLSSEMLPVDQLIISPVFQREEDTPRVREMAANWNWLGCGTLAVSLRETDQGNVYSVIDGQQRLAAIKLQGYKEAPCRIYIDLTEAQEAWLYELLNKNKKPGFNDLFKSRLSRNEDVATAIRIAVEQSGYHLDPERKHTRAQAKDSHYYIQTMKELVKMYEAGGVLHIMETLKLICEIWAPEPLREQALILSGTSRFVRDYKGANRKDLIFKLQQKGLLRVTQMAYQWLSIHGKLHRTAGFSEAMLAVYNERRQEGNRIRSKNY